MYINLYTCIKVVFCPNAPRFPEGRCFLEGSFLLEQRVGEDECWVLMEWCMYIEENRNTRRKTFFPCYFAYHLSHLDRPGINPRSPIILKFQFLPRRRHTHTHTHTHTHNLLYKKLSVNVVYGNNCYFWEIHTKHINTLCGQNVEFLNVKPSGTHGNHWDLKG